MDPLHLRPPSPFIVGAQRSGTTLLRLMLDAHPLLCIPSETHFLPLVLKLRGSEPYLRNSFRNAVVTFPRWHDFGISKADFVRALEDIPEFSVPEGIRAFYLTYARHCQKERWGDKTPAYATHLAEIQSALPEAYFVHLIRDGRDVAVSNREAWWSYGILDCARLWVNTVRETRRQAQACAQAMEVRYEDLVTDPKRILTKVCDFIDLPYDTEMESYHRRSRSRLSEIGDLVGNGGRIIATRFQRSDIHRLTERPADASRIGRWRREMSQAEVKGFEGIAGDLLRELGY